MPEETVEDITDLTDENVPLSDMPSEEEELVDMPDEPVPLAAMPPQTGDNSMIMLYLVLMLAGGALLSLRKKEQNG